MHTSFLLFSMFNKRMCWIKLTRDNYWHWPLDRELSMLKIAKVCPPNDFRTVSCKIDVVLNAVTFYCHSCPARLMSFLCSFLRMMASDHTFVNYITVLLSIIANFTLVNLGHRNYFARSHMQIMGRAKFTIYTKHTLFNRWMFPYYCKW